MRSELLRRGLVGFGVGFVGFGGLVDLAEALAAGPLDEGGPVDAGVAGAFGAGFADDLVEAAAGAAGADRRAAADTRAAGIFERRGAGRPGLVLGIVRIAAKRFGDPVALGVGLAGADDDRVVGARRAGIVAIDDHRADLGFGGGRLRLRRGGQSGEQRAGSGGGEEEGSHVQILFDSAMAIRQPARMREDNRG